MLIRPAKASELDYLTERLIASDHEKVDLKRGLVWVAEDEGKIVGMLPLRLIWQAEPLFLFDELENKTSRRRAAFLLALEMESFVGDRVRNKTGIHSYFAVIKDEIFKALAKRWGLLHIYKTCETWGRDL